MTKININQVLASLRVENPNELSETELAFAEAFVRQWPTAADYLHKFHKHPGCSTCRRDMIEILTDDPMALQRFVESAPPLVDTTTAVRKPQAAYSAAGRCVDIPDTPEAFSDFIRSIKATNGKYSGVQVRPLEGTNMVRVYVY